MGVLFKELLSLNFIKSDVKSTDASSESSLSAIALTELVEIEEEFSDADSVLGSQCLKSLLNIQLRVKLC